MLHTYDVYLQRDPGIDMAKFPPSCSVPVTFNDEKEPVGTADRFQDRSDGIVATLHIHQKKWFAHARQLQEGCAVYAGPFKIIGPVGTIPS